MENEKKYIMEVIFIKPIELPCEEELCKNTLLFNVVKWDGILIGSISYMHIQLKYEHDVSELYLKADNISSFQIEENHEKVEKETTIEPKLKN